MTDQSIQPLVVMVANYPRGAGYAWWLMQRYWDEIAEAARERGWKSVEAYPPGPAGEDPQDPNSLDELVAFLSEGGITNSFHCYRMVRRYNVRSLYLTDRPFRSWRYLFLRIAGIRSIVAHDHAPGDRPATHGMRGLAKYLLNSVPWLTADRSVAVSPWMKVRQLMNARIPASRIETVTNGIVIRDLVPDARERLLERFTLDSQKYILCGIGRLNPYKRFDFAIQCVGELVRQGGRHPVLILLGDGPDRVRLEELATSLGLDRHVIFAGQVADVWPILCGVDAVIHPSAGEGLSLAILEAMAAARPVLVPGIRSVAQTIDHGINGFVYEEGSLEDAVGLLRELSLSEERRLLVGRNARAKVLDHYQLDRALKDFRDKVIPVILGSG
jgi:glycosyltransferase involved in cell wall biosynthesis